VVTQVSPFHFDDSELPSSPALVAEVPAGIATKEALFDELYKCLEFPDYFGSNWDAVWECVRDLSWLPDGPVLLKHRDVPMADDVGNQKKYVSILRDTVERNWAVPGQHLRDLVVVFPADKQEHVRWLLLKKAKEELSK
jgi:RNAse (barnase) inhibitor barstar